MAAINNLRHYDIIGPVQLNTLPKKVIDEYMKYNMNEWVNPTQMRSGTIDQFKDREVEGWNNNERLYKICYFNCVCFYYF